MARKKEEPDDDITPLYIAEKAAREFVEQIGADAVVILWTVQNKRMTKFWRHQIGNGILCNALIEKTAEEQQETEEAEEEEEDD